jgi:hypothetical protein
VTVQPNSVALHRTRSIYRVRFSNWTVLSRGNLVHSLNCYYSNLIEGHDTHPSDIDRALHKDYSTEPRSG